MIIVRQPVTNMAINQAATQAKDMNVKLFNFNLFNKGKTELQAFFEKNAYIPEETAQVHVVVDNTNC